MSEYNVRITKDDTHVYCTECAWLIYTDDGIPACKYEKECDIWDPEDSKPLLDRPYYKPVKADSEG